MIYAAFTRLSVLIVFKLNLSLASQIYMTIFLLTKYTALHFKIRFLVYDTRNRRINFSFNALKLKQNFYFKSFKTFSYENM